MINTSDNSSTVVSGLFLNKSTASKGSAIYNSGSQAKLGFIEADFISNCASSSKAYGGAIYNYSNDSGTIAEIGDITGDFIGNYASATATVSGGNAYTYAYGGAI